MIISTMIIIRVSITMVTIVVVSTSVPSEIIRSLCTCLTAGGAIGDHIQLMIRVM